MTICRYVLCTLYENIDIYRVQFEQLDENGYKVLRVEEAKLNASNAPVLKDRLIALRNSQDKNLVLDLSGVEFIDSSGLSAILTARRIYEDHGTFVVAGPLSSAVKKVVEISKLDTILTIIPTIEEAIDYVIMADVERALKEEE